MWFPAIKEAEEDVTLLYALGIFFRFIYLQHLLTAGKCYMEKLYGRNAKITK